MKIIRSYASARMVQYVMHPVIEAIYDNIPYMYKGIIVAYHPWTGNYKIEPSLWVVAQFTQFMQPGWSYINRGSSSETYTFTLNGFNASSPHVWQTTEHEQFANLPDVPINSKDGYDDFGFDVAVLDKALADTKTEICNGQSFLPGFGF